MNGNPPEQQQHTSHKASAPDQVKSEAPSSGADPQCRYASWTVTAMFGLFFDILAPVMGLVATLFALLRLRQIRRTPQRYKGRGFCWAAIVLALVVATLSLLVEPSFESRVSPSQHVPGSSPDRAIS